MQKIDNPWKDFMRIQKTRKCFFQESIHIAYGTVGFQNKFE